MSRFYGYADFGGEGILCDKVADLLDRLDADDDDAWARELLEAAIASDLAKKTLKKKCNKLRGKALAKVSDKMSGKSSDKSSGSTSGRSERDRKKSSDRKGPTLTYTPPALPAETSVSSAPVVYGLPPQKTSVAPLAVAGTSVALIVAGFLL